MSRQEINGSQIQDGTITNIDISASAAIAVSKINGAVPLSLISDTKQFTGFDSPENTTITLDPTARTITLGGTVQAYFQGKVVSALISGWVSPAYPTGQTVNQYLTYNGTSFSWSTTFPTFDLLWIAFALYTNTGFIEERECHGWTPYQVHDELHNIIGTRLDSGGSISNTVLNSTTVANRRPYIAQTSLFDEDLNSTNLALSTNSYTQMYLTSTGIETFSTANADIVNLSGNQPYYNQFTGGSWQQTLITANNYMNVWLLAIPVGLSTNAQNFRYCFLQGQDFGTLAAMQQEITNNINLGTFINDFPEFVFLAKFIIHYSSAAGGNWSIAEIDTLKGTKWEQVQLQGNFLSSVTTDTTLTGNGTVGNALGINTNGVANTNLAQMTANTYKGNNTGSTADPSNISTNTAFNQNFETLTSNIKMNGTVSVGTSSNISRADHVHPTDTSLTFQRLNQQLVLNIIKSNITSASNIRRCIFFDETGATTALKDRSTNLINATLSANASTLYPAVTGGCRNLYFTSSAYFGWPDADDLSFGNGTTDSAFSIIALINPNSVGGDIIAKYDYTGSVNHIEYSFEFYAGHGLDVELFDTRAGHISRYQNASLSGDIGSWHVYAMTYSGSSTEAGIKLYRDGVRVDDSSGSGGTYTSMQNWAAPVGNYGIDSGGNRDYIGNYKAGFVQIIAEELTVTAVKNISNALLTYVGNDSAYL